jgi:DNA-binding response OmpR family regulator
MRPNNKQKIEVLAKISRHHPKVLLAEGYKDMRDLLNQALQKAGYEVVECSDTIELLTLLRPYFLFDQEREEFDLIICDIHMSPGKTELNVMRVLQKQHDFPPFILITEFSDENTYKSAIRSGAAAIFNKPFDINELLIKVREIVPFPN